MTQPCRPPCREHRLLRPRAARRRHSGRARRGARRARSGAGGRRRHARGFLLDAACGVREAARAFGAVRSGVPHFLPPPRLHRSAAGDDAAAGAVGAAGAAGRRHARARGAVLRPRRQAQEGARDRARRAHDRVRPRGAAAQGFRADDDRRDRRRQGGDEAAGAAARRSAHAAAGAAPARPSDRHPPHACAPA